MGHNPGGMRMVCYDPAERGLIKKLGAWRREEPSPFATTPDGIDNGASRELDTASETVPV